MSILKTATITKFPCRHKSGMVVHQFPAGTTLDEIRAFLRACPDNLKYAPKGGTAK